MPKSYSLVIVESPAKARTISRFLGKDYVVEASIGHIRDLPRTAAEIPAKYKKETWSRLGVNVYKKFEPIYIEPSDKRKQIKKLQELLKEAKDLYLATDEDREGEAISWHLVETLKPDVPIHRLVFHEITKSAIDEALSSPRSIDYRLVEAQETRRIIDRLFGYEVSPLLWRKIAPKLSAGRVQSVAVRLIVEREKERIAFHSANYWDLLGLFNIVNAGMKPLQGVLISVGKQKIPAGKDFDSATGKLLKPDDFILLGEPAVKKLAEHLLQKPAEVKSVEEKPYTERPYPPFTTSTLQQEANRKFGFTARTTMSLAQSLYENGYITYMRTDSTNLSEEALRAARNHIGREYGKEYLPPSPRYYKTNVKNAQEAHEAVRPAGSVFELPENLRGTLTGEQYRLYDLIWKRTIASQMTDAKIRRKQITIQIDDALFSASGKMIEFAGYFRAYVEGSDDPEADLADRETLLPDVKTGDTLRTQKLEPKPHITQPPGRYSEAALTKTLTDKGIGRPSTYASIIETILARNYVFKKGGALVPTWTAFSVSRLLEEHLPGLVDYAFTAQMEDQLDAISRGELKSLHYLKEFYFDSSKGLQPLVEHLSDKNSGKIDPAEVNSFVLPSKDSVTENFIVVRNGRFGPYVQRGEERGSIPNDLPPDELTHQKALELLESAQRAEKPLGVDPETQKPVFIKSGRFGTYIQLGETEDKDKKNASLLKGMTAETVDLKTALQLLTLPRYLGNYNGEDVVVQNGKFGPYISCGKETRSLPEDVSPLDVVFLKAEELLSQPKVRRHRAAATAPKEPLKAFADSPVTGKPVRVLEGRFGDYITDGVTNVTVPKGMALEEITFESATDMLAAKAAKGPAVKRTVRKKAARKAGYKRT
ncbi:MAG: type I DNA topoisomerase [Planctomycetaceae bacterium]|jgi:DNA topoisomerase-1|nr:type I DNA topoisomerase [Planctomycetaceae bacterium]